MLSTKELVFKKQPARKLVDQYVGPYIIKEVISINTVKLRLLTLIRIHLVINISWVIRYGEPVKGQKMEKPKPVKVNKVEEYKVEILLNKQKIRDIVKYLIHWKRFIVEYDI